ncbi:hypothetical protein K2173_004278 [Erythroxylum novogranatense]|uniref:Sulfite exporter TauE/SafE family protein n=1 Tax=Erythroxylum novogranatense TaxID=1862640 RepID=A0AAV8U6H4_9ROSI|nr:hypothetical protein K2173_004278 [Erythroxylum novogranatense]
MARAEVKRLCLRLLTAVISGSLIGISLVVVADSNLRPESSIHNGTKESEFHQARRVLSFFYQKGRSSYKHVWPGMEFGWKIVVCTIIGFFGAACGTVGGVGGGGIFVPMLTLIIGFDAKSSTAISKCMVTGAAGSTVYYNLKLRHPTLELPIIDYDLALLCQPMLLLGISIGVALNVVFPDWMITILIIVIFLATSTKSLIKGVETWKKETKSKKEAIKQREAKYDDTIELEAKPPLEDPTIKAQPEDRASKREEVSIIENVYWKELGLLVAVWLIILVLQIGKNYSKTCSVAYWVLNILQIPTTIGVTLYEAVCLNNGRRKIASRGEENTYWRVDQLVLYSVLALLAGIIGGMLGLGGGFILGPLFLEMGIPPQVSSATATFAMIFSASMSGIEYYLLKRFPIPYTLYFFVVAAISALVGQHVVRKLISVLGRSSIIIFALVLTIFVSILSLGGVGVAHMIKKIERKEYMGFESICS